MSFVSSGDPGCSPPGLTRPPAMLAEFVQDALLRKGNKGNKDIAPGGLRLHTRASLERGRHAILPVYCRISESGAPCSHKGF
jgi:hypothetical protein